MNLRQKYKRAKQQLEWYRNETTKPLYVQEEKQIETLRATYMITSLDIRSRRIIPPESFIKEQLCKTVGGSIKDYITITIQNSELGDVSYIAEIKVVKP